MDILDMARHSGVLCLERSTREVMIRFGIDLKPVEYRMLCNLLSEPLLDTNHFNDQAGKGSIWTVTACAQLYMDYLEKGCGAQPWIDIPAMLQRHSALIQAQNDQLLDSDKIELRTLSRAESSGLLRVPLDAPDPSAILALGVQFPNFIAPLQFIAGQVALMQMDADKRLTIPPMLLVGPPGIGKTRFAMRLAACLRTPCYTLNMASQSCGFTLGGLDPGWSNAKPGLIYEALSGSKTCSPLVFLDEIEKAAREARSDPLGPLFSLLEPESAKRFKDECLPVAMDASQVIWVAAANELHGLPEPIINRFTVFYIESPSSVQLRDIARDIYQSLIAGKATFPPDLPDACLAQLQVMSPRNIHLRLRTLVAEAALRFAQSGNQDDLVIRNSVIYPAGKYTGGKIGFF